MHSNHKILINLKRNNICDAIPPQSRDLIKNDIKERIEELTERFEGKVFDYRNFEDVIFSSDNIDTFIEELQGCLNTQRADMTHHLLRVCETSSDLQKLFQLFAKGEDRWDWDLKRFAEMVYGKYTFDSMFFDIDNFTAKITNETINEVRETPKDWALAVFDCHM